MAFAFIGQAVATNIIDRVVSAGWTAVQESLLPANDIEGDLERLQRALPQIKAVLSAVDSGEINNQNEALTSWMWQFRDAVESAEDVLDEMAYYELEEKIQKQNEEVGSSTSGLKRKLNSFANCMLADNHGILKRLAKAVKGLDEVAFSVHNFLYLQSGPGRFSGKISEDKNVENDRETGSMITESVVFGRENERNSIVEWLTANDPSSGDVTLSAFTIYGVGGLGKTTLAQLICNDEKVKQFFDTIIWVCVSDQFDAAKIIAKILEVMSKESPKISCLTSLQDVLKEQLRSKKFLLILDDVWNDENRSQWEKVVAPLKFGYGKILMTTRMESVANMAAKVIEGKMGHLKLAGLEEEEFFMLFKKHAFDGVDPDEFRNLHPIGKQITKKLGGCPLAAKIMGGVLNYSMEFEYWNKVLKEDVPNFHEAKDGIMIVLRLSYCHLPTYLQLCFRYCSIFPKDYVFEKDELIKMWMGSGLIETVCERQMPENVGREYFNRLVRKSFFDLKQDYDGKDYSVMHDLLHDLSQSVSEGECVRIEKCPSSVPRTIRHLGFNMENLLAIKKISHLKNLRTLFIKFNGDNPDSDNIQIFSEVLKRLKSLRLLRIIIITRNCMFKIPDTIGELIHLRYLSHESSKYRSVKLPWFPVSVYKLYHLEVIRFLEAYWNIREGFEANGMHNLINLRHLDVGSKIYSQIPFIGKLTFPFIGKLTFLQELEKFHILPESGHRITELRDLRSLHKLDIHNLNEVSDPAVAIEVKLNEKEYLNNLSLSWSGPNRGSPARDEQLADNLQPHIYLQELSINGYDGMRCPTWMTHLHLINLIFLKLSRCSLLASVPALGKFSLLKRLRLSHLPQVKKIDQIFYGNDIKCAFPVLKELMLFGMLELQDWDEIQGITLFPRLEKLSVENCPNLRKLPSLPPSLEKLHIDNAGLEILPRIYPSYNNGIIFPSSLSYLSVSRCPNLTSLVGCMLEQHGVMRALSELYIYNCEGLMYFPSRGFNDFSSLKDFNICKCPMLVAAPGTQDILLPVSLQRLSIEQCGLDVLLLRSVKNFNALTQLILDGCPLTSSLTLFEILATLTTLNKLEIRSCPELSLLIGLEALTSLRRLTILNCDKLTTTSLSQPPLSVNANDSNQLQLEFLTVDRASLLLLEPLRSLKLTEELNITDASGLTCLPEEWLLQNHSALRRIVVDRATSLEHLPSCMDRLQMLECLQIDDALLIQSLPDLLSSLRYLVVAGCHPVLKERYEKDSGPEWHKIAFISDVDISKRKEDSKWFQMTNRLLSDALLIESASRSV
ncbi:hypothetical protein LUZ60_000467 [Juncus effusus]|nr:hypothetical protein LUZ60_000467 [Juncus effusus]